MFDECPTCGTFSLVPTDECFACGWTGNEPEDQPAEDMDFDVDHLGDWSDIKHAILSDYAPAYTKILRAKPFVRRIIYVDAFAGPGVALARDTGEKLDGSVTRMAKTDPPFDELHCIELDERKAAALRDAFAGDRRVVVHEGDCNQVLVPEILPRCRYSQYTRALVLLDPYGLAVDWSVLEALGKERSIEIFFNFMIVDANRNVLWRDPSKVSASRKERMNRVWPGDWERDLYRQTPTLFDPVPEKLTNAEVVEIYRQKLKEVAGFTYVPEPIPMKNSRNATIYYLFFAGHDPTGAKIVQDIFRKFRGRASRSSDARRS